MDKQNSKSKSLLIVKINSYEKIINLIKKKNSLQCLLNYMEVWALIYFVSTIISWFLFSNINPSYNKLQRTRSTTVGSRRLELQLVMKIILVFNELCLLLFTYKIYYSKIYNEYNPNFNLVSVLLQSTTKKIRELMPLIKTEPLIKTSPEEKILCH